MTQQFRTELFTDPTEYEEEPLRDRKSQLPNLRRDDDKAEFIRDVIALANTARTFGHLAYLLYGLSDNVDDGPLICGLGDSLNVYGISDTHQAWEQFQKEIGQAVLDYIKPLLNLELKHSQIGEHKVAYLQILPLTPPTVFQTRKSIKNQFRTDQTWRRFGESKREIKRQEIAPDDDQYRYAYSQVPYILPRVWQRYSEGILNDRNSAENLTVAQDIRGYQDLYTTEDQFLQQVVTQFLNGSETFMVIEGAAGSGKSAFVWRWIVAQAEAQLQAMEQKIEREEFTPPVGWVPVYHRLRNEPVRTNYRLETRLLDAINKKSESSFWSGKRPSQPEELFRKPDLHWVICLDGLDEIRTQEQQAVFIETLRDFWETYSYVKVILTTRPDTGIGTLKTCGNTVTIAPFNDMQAMLYLQNWAESEDYAEFVEFLRSDDELWELCRTPAYLEAACQQLTGMQFTSFEPIITRRNDITLTQDNRTFETGKTPIPQVPRAKDEALLLDDTITNVEEAISEFSPEELPRPLEMGEVLYEMYAYLWRREGSRRASFGPQNANIWWEKTGRLALKMDGLQFSILETKARSALGATALRHVLSLGILKRNPRLVGFNTELTKAYFAAAWLRDCLETNDVPQARRLLAPATVEFQQRVRDLLEPLTVKDIQPLFQGGEL